MAVSVDHLPEDSPPMPTTKARNSRKYEEDNIDLFRVLRGFSSFRGEELVSPLQLEHVHAVLAEINTPTRARNSRKCAEVNIDLLGVLRGFPEFRGEVLDSP